MDLVSLKTEIFSLETNREWNEAPFIPKYVLEDEAIRDSVCEDGLYLLQNKTNDHVRTP